MQQQQQHELPSSHRLLLPPFPPPPAQPPPPSSLRKIHVVYFLCRSSGHLEQPHLLEVSIPSNHGLFLKDVKNRLSAIRGSKLPSSFAWSYKRSYKNEYVWQDLCDDDLIFPAHGCDYVLKGSEILTENNEESAPSTDGDGIKSHQKQRADSVELVAGIDPQKKRDLHPQQLVVTCANPNTGIANSSAISVVNPAAHPVCMTESGTDAATQTEADNQNGSHEEEETAHHLDQIQQRSASATELDIKADMPSPPSSSSTMSSSPYNLCMKNAAAKGEEESDCNKKAMVRRSSKVDIADRDKEIRVVGCGTNSEEEEAEAGEEEDDDEDARYRSVSNLMKQHTAVGCRSVPFPTTSVRSSDKSNPINANSTSQFRSSTTDKSSNQTHLLHELLHQSPSSTPTSSTSSQKSRRSSQNNHCGDSSSSPSFMKQQCIQSATLSLLQFMSCGRSDIRDQILPMSLYRLRSCKSSASVSDDVVDDEASIPDSCSGVANPATEQNDVCRSYDGLNHRAANWLKIGGSKSSGTKQACAANQRVSGGHGETPGVPINDDIAAPDSIGMGEAHNNLNDHHQHNRHRHIQSDPAMFSTAQQSERNDLNLNIREADNRLQVNKNQAAAMASREASSTGNTGLHTRRLSSEAMNYMWKSSPLKLGSSCKELAIAAGANHSSNLLMQRSSGELLHCNYICNGSKSSCSPLFVPGKQYINAGVQLELLSKPCYSINHHVANPRINDHEAPNHKPNPVSSSTSCANAVNFRKSGDAADAERI